MKQLDSINEELIKETNSNTEDKNVIINYNEKLTFEELMAIESIKKIKNPFQMIDVKTVMSDLNICKTIAYRLFQREDFPSINIGKNNQVMILPYIIWKMNKRV